MSDWQALPMYEPDEDASWKVRLAEGYEIDFILKSDAFVISAAPEMLKALRGLLRRYIALVESGDAGNWDPHDEAEVKTAKAALAKAEGR